MNTRAARTAAIDRLRQLLQFGGDPPFEACHFYEPQNIPYARVIHFWFDGEEEPAAGRKTLGNVMTAHRFQVRAYYALPQTWDEAEAIELQMWHDCRDVQASVVADSMLSGNVTECDIEFTGPGAEEFGEGRFFRTASWIVRLDELEGEAISA